MTCCCQRRRRPCPNPPCVDECDPSKFPSSVRISGTFDTSCRMGLAAADVYSGGPIAVVAPFVGSPGYYEGVAPISISVLNHNYTASRPTLQTTVFAKASILSCAYAEWDIRQPWNWAFGMRLNAAFRNLDQRCGTCGMAYMAGMKWYGEFCDLQQHYGSECCGDMVGMPDCRCQCPNEFLCGDGSAGPIVCNPCKGLTDMSSATCSVT